MYNTAILWWLCPPNTLAEVENGFTTLGHTFNIYSFCIEFDSQASSGGQLPSAFGSAHIFEWINIVHTKF
jgi:hypothetical protein